MTSDPIDIRTDPTRGRACFTPTEWTVVAIGRRDHPRTLRQASPWLRRLSKLFGERRSPMLADPRLEALRRMTILARQHDYALPLHEVEAFVTAGYSRCQLELLFAHCGASRLEARRPTADRLVPRHAVCSPIAPRSILQPAFA